MGSRMIVDVHTHRWESPEQLGPAWADRLLRHAAAAPWERPDASGPAHEEATAPVSFAIIHGFISRHLGAAIDAEAVAAYVARRPDKFLGFAGIDPMAGDYLGEFDRARQLGLVGVTISPAAQAFHPTHTRAMALYERCEATGTPIFVHPETHLGATTKMEFGLPYLFDEVARTFPDLKLVLGQVGHPWVDQTLTLIGKHPNVYADLSDLVTRPWQLYNVLHMAYQQDVCSQLLFGSDYPFMTPQQAIVTIYSVNTLTQGTHLPSVPREQLRSIVERDALSALGLKAPSEPPPPAETPVMPTASVTTGSAPTVNDVPSAKVSTKVEESGTPEGAADAEDGAEAMAQTTDSGEGAEEPTSEDSGAGVSPVGGESRQ